MVESFVRFFNAWWPVLGTVWAVFGIWFAYVYGFRAALDACRVEDDVQEWPSERGLL